MATQTRSQMTSPGSFASWCVVISTVVTSLVGCRDVLGIERLGVDPAEDGGWGDGAATEVARPEADAERSVVDSSADHAVDGWSPFDGTLDAGGDDGSPDGVPSFEGGTSDGGSDVAALDDALDDALDGALTCSATLTSDPEHCGHCGRSCLGHACFEGRCEPQIDSVPYGSGWPFDVALIGPQLYVGITSGTVLGCVASACEPRTVADVEWNGRIMSRIVGNDSWIAFAFQRNDESPNYTWSIYVCPAAGCDAKPQPWLTAESGEIAALYAEGDELYWAVSGGQVRHRSRNGSAPPEVVGTFPADTGASLGQMTATSKDWFVAIGTTIYRIPRLGGPAETFATLAYEPGELVVSGDRVFWTEVQTAFVSGPAVDRGVVKSKPIESGPTITYTSVREVISRLSVSGGDLYWLVSNNDTSRLEWCPTSGCVGKPTIIADVSGAEDLVVDRDYVRVMMYGEELRSFPRW